MDDNKPAITSRPVKIRFDKGYGWRARIGFVLIATDRIIEREMFRLAPEGVGVYFTRLPSEDRITLETLAAMEKGLTDAAACLLPGCGLDVICFACTSGSAVIGEERVIAKLSRGAPGARATTLISGVIRALQTLKTHRLVVATPYLDEINDLEARYLQKIGFEVLDIQGMNILKDTDIGKVAPDFILEYAQSLDRPDAQAIFVSCGALRTLDIIDKLEQRVGKPVVTSNQAMFWDTLRLAGIADKIEGYGRLLRLH
ncbi:MAG: aspartate/glutamate racemase family protein [Deltaproteobacteria bacterium]|nr:MAG: aspartate/glutamate racemase family protein [Deltaproteobacteria bacterium]